MPNQPTPPNVQPPPNLPNFPDASETLSNYLRRFSLWCQQSLGGKVDTNLAQAKVLLQESGVTGVPRVYALTVVVTGGVPSVHLTQVGLGGGNPSP